MLSIRHTGCLNNALGIAFITSCSGSTCLTMSAELLCLDVSCVYVLGGLLKGLQMQDCYVGGTQDRLRSSPMPSAFACCISRVQANSMPAMFWSLALLLLPQHADARARVLQELRGAIHKIKQQQQQQGQPAQAQNLLKDKHQQQQQPGDGLQQGQQEAVPALDEATVSAMLALALDKRSWVSCCVAEAIRLRLHSIAGKVAWLDLNPSNPYAAGTPGCRAKRACTT